MFSVVRSEGRQQGNGRRFLIMEYTQIPLYHHSLDKEHSQDNGNSVCFGLEILPVLVEATTAFFRQMLGPDCSKGTETEWSFDVSNNTDNDHWWGFQDGDSLNDFLLVDLWNGGKMQLV